MPMQVGVLTVRIVRASRLRGANLDGSSDPYVRVRACGVEKRTRVVWRNLNPVWEEEIWFMSALQVTAPCDVTGPRFELPKLLGACVSSVSR